MVFFGYHKADKLHNRNFQGFQTGENRQRLVPGRFMFTAAAVEDRDRPMPTARPSRYPADLVMTCRDRFFRTCVQDLSMMNFHLEIKFLPQGTTALGRILGPWEGSLRARL
jgi:hypothetical protein